MASIYKKRKVDNESRIFNEDWRGKYFFTEVNGCCVCLLCKDTVAVCKEYNIRRHYETKHVKAHKNLSEKEKKALAMKASESLLKEQQVFTTQTCISERSTRASFVIAHKIAQESKAFNEGEFVKDCLLACSDILCPKERNAFDSVSLSRRTITRRVEEIAKDLDDQVKDDCTNCVFFSLALDESTDIKNTAQLLIFIRTIDLNFKITEELASMESMKGTTTGEDLIKAVDMCIRKIGISWNKLASVTTDGSPNLWGKHIGFLKLLQDKLHIDNPDQNIICLHCIIHQHALCKGALGLSNVTEVVTKLVNYIKARGLNHRQFQSLLQDMEAPYADVPYHTKVRWLSLGKVLKSVWALKEEIFLFLALKEKESDFPELYDNDWVTDFAFAVDIMEYMNELNTNLQGKDMFVHNMYAKVVAFQTKLLFIYEGMKKGNCNHMPTLNRTAVCRSKLEYYASKLQDLHKEFSERFGDFDLLKVDMFVISRPFSVEVQEIPTYLQMEIIDLQSDNLLRDKFHEMSLPYFYATLNDNTYLNLKSMARKILALFGSTYVCEQAFSRMKFNKNKSRSVLTDEHLSHLMRIATSVKQPNFDKLINIQDQLHNSH